MKDLKIFEEGLIPVYQNAQGKRLVDARELHKVLGVRRDFTTWIKGRIKEYGFTKNIDYALVFTKTGENSKGGRPRTDYILIIDMAKELAMVENNDRGRLIRRYFIEVENKYRELITQQQNRLIQREAGKIIRNMLTDTIKDKVPESPHKHFAYPNYTRLIYKILFNKTVAELRADRGLAKKENLREHFNADELVEIKTLENIIAGLLNLGMGYQEIKNMLNQKYLKQLQG